MYKPMQSIEFMFQILDRIDSTAYWRALDIYTDPNYWQYSIPARNGLANHPICAIHLANNIDAYDEAPHGVLDGLFAWERTPYGHKYWCDVYDKLYDYCAAWFGDEYAGGWYQDGDHE